jgi:hypothetical protein
LILELLRQIDEETMPSIQALLYAMYMGTEKKAFCSSEKSANLSCASTLRSVENTDRHKMQNPDLHKTAVKEDKRVQSHHSK